MVQNEAQNENQGKSANPDGEDEEEEDDEDEESEYDAYAEHVGMSNDELMRELEQYDDLAQ